MPLRTLSKFKPQGKNVNCVLMNGGVGDHVGSLVAINHILTHYTWINLLIWVPDFLLEFAKNVLPSKAIVRDYSAMKTKYNREFTSITTEWDGRTSPMKIHSVDYAFLKLCDELVSLDKKNYLKVKFNQVDTSSFTLPEKYVVLATGYTAKVREFDPQTVNEISDYLIYKGVTPVFLGQTETKTGAVHVIQGSFSKDIDYSKGLSLINKTSLVQAAKIMQGAVAMVGVDCGLMHIAGCTSVPIVGGFTTVNPELRAPIRDNVLGKDFYPIVPDKFLECRFCQVSTNFLYGHDYKWCIYNDYECVKQLTSAKFIEQLNKIIS